MKIKKPANKKILILSIAAIVGVLSLSGLAYATLNEFNKQESETESKNTDDNSIPPASEQEIQTGNTIKQNSIENKTSDTDNNPEPVQDPNSNKQTVGVEITGINKDSDTLVVRTLIQTIDNTGECTITLTGPSKTYVDTAATQATARVSTCQGFNIPLSELSSGKWNIQIDYQSDSTQGKTNSEVVI